MNKNGKLPGWFVILWFLGTVALLVGTAAVLDLYVFDASQTTTGCCCHAVD